MVCRSYPGPVFGCMSQTPHSPKHFDEVSSRWDENPGRVKMAGQHFEAIQQHVSLHTGMRVLDYGCGTGLVSLALRPYVQSVIGLDGSAGMIAVMNEKIRSGGLQHCEGRAFDPNAELLPGIPDASLDLIVSTMTFHHVPDIRAVLKEFRRALTPSGQVCVLDLATEDGSFHEDPNSGAVHKGFSAEELHAAFSAVGLNDIRVTTAFVHTRPSTGRSYPVLMALGRA